VAFKLECLGRHSPGKSGIFWKGDSLEGCRSKVFEGIGLAAGKIDFSRKDRNGEKRRILWPDFSLRIIRNDRGALKQNGINPLQNRLMPPQKLLTALTILRQVTKTKSEMVDRGSKMKARNRQSSMKEGEPLAQLKRMMNIARQDAGLCRPIQRQVGGH
jgi:hypothetical protein